MAAALADDLRDVFLAAFEIVGQRVVTLRLFQGIEIFPLHVFNDRDFKRVGVADVNRNDRHLVKAGRLRSAPTALAGDNLVTLLRALYRADHDRLDHAMLFNRVSELAEFRVGKCPARIARVGSQKFNRHLALRAWPVDMRGLAADIADQTCKTAAQSRTRFVGHRQLPWIQLARSCSMTRDRWRRSLSLN